MLQDRKCEIQDQNIAFALVAGDNYISFINHIGNYWNNTNRKAKVDESWTMCKYFIKIFSDGNDVVASNSTSMYQALLFDGLQEEGLVLNVLGLIMIFLAVIIPAVIACNQKK